MNKMAKMMLVNGRGKGRRVGIEYEDYRPTDNYRDNYRLMGNYGPTDNYDDAESRFRDRRGREHYDNGRFAPQSNMDEPYSRGYRRHEDGTFAPRNEDWDEWGAPRMPRTYDDGGERMNTIGFDRGPRMGGSDATVPRYNEMERMRGGQPMRGYSEGYGAPEFDKRMAEEWTRSMKNEDGTTGPHWTFEQAKQVMTQRNIDCDPLEFWVALNAMYSDYSQVLRKHGIGDKMDVYADLAKAFLDDKDAQRDKLARYYEYVVKH